jgi:hypothetical protein
LWDILNFTNFTLRFHGKQLGATNVWFTTGHRQTDRHLTRGFLYVATW